MIVEFGPQNRSFEKHKRSRQGRKTRNRSETPCFVAFRVRPPRRHFCDKPEEHQVKERASRKGGQKSAQNVSKMALFPSEKSDFANF